MQKIEHNSLCETETYKGMTDNEIIKALEGMTYGGHSCMHCKYGTTKSEDRCGLQGCKIGRDALDLINRQQAEIERLQKIIVGFMDEVGTWSNKYNVDISNIHKLPLLAKEDWNIRHKIKSEAIKEFAERLKNEAFIDRGFEVLQSGTIDNLVKEMTEVSENG